RWFGAFLSLSTSSAAADRDGPRSGGAGGPRPQHVARARWSGAFLSLSTSYAAADRGMCLTSELRERKERGVYAASAWHIRCDVVDFPEPRGSEDREAA